MNPLDMGILGIVALSSLIGLFRGVTKEVLSLITWSGSVALTYLMLPVFQDFMRTQISNPMIADVLTGGLLFFVSLLILSLLSNTLSGMVRDSCLGSIDRGMGLLFGIVRSVVLICGMELAWSTLILRPHQSDLFQSARFISFVRRGSDDLFEKLPLPLQKIILTQKEETLKKIPSSPPLSLLPEDLSPSEALPIDPSTSVPSSSALPKPTAHQKQKDLEKTAESLSKLTPKTVDPKNAGDYNDQQRRGLDRLIDMN